MNNETEQPRVNKIKGGNPKKNINSYKTHEKSLTRLQEIILKKKNFQHVPHHSMNNREQLQNVDGRSNPSMNGGVSDGKASSHSNTFAFLCWWMW